MILFVDTHCHLDFPEFDPDREEVIRRAQAQAVGYLVNIGSSLSGSRRSVELAQRFPHIYCSVGIHPHEADGFGQQQEAALRELAKKEKVAAIGETGLDYFKNYSTQPKQKILFAALIALAKELSLPLVIHSRQAQEDTMRMLREAMPLKAVVHCFSGDEGFLAGCLELGFFISFTCNITYKKAHLLRELVKSAPLERLMLETDAPYLPPEGLRGKRNEPLYVGRLAEEIAGIKQLKLEEIAEVTTANARVFFKLK